MDEKDAEFRARALIAETNPAALPVNVEDYAKKIGAVIKWDATMGPGESGSSFVNTGKRYICVNANESLERQRFTICHEIAHAVLGLPSEHDSVPSSRFVKRAPNEMLCDLFAAELLLPVQLFRPLVVKAECSILAIDELAHLGEASFPATGSRFAAFAPYPCAFVFSQRGLVRYGSRSTPLREAKAWVPPKTAIPEGSMSARLRSGEVVEGPMEVEADAWFSDWNRGGTLLEDARHYKQWDQTLTLLWFEDEELPQTRPGTREQEEETGLAELSGVLPWPGSKKRKR